MTVANTTASSTTEGNVTQSTLRAVPYTREFLADALTPLATYRRLRTTSPYAFLLESVTGGEQVSRFSFLGAAPREVYALHLDRLEIWRPDAASPDSGSAPGPGASTVTSPVTGSSSMAQVEIVRERPLEALRARLEGIVSEPGSPHASPLPLAGGFVGYFGWDLVRLIERLPDRPPDPFGLPIALLARFDDVVVFDHARQRVVAVANAIEGESDEADANRRLDALERLLVEPGESGAVVLRDATPPGAAVSPPSLSAEQYQAAVSLAKEHIAAGDIFQVVLARRWEVEEPLPPLALYRALRVVNPSPYMVLFETPEVSLVGGSPEMLVRVEAGRFETRPLAGTRPRGKSAAEDARLAAEMLADPKERAEHVMLVDLGRNDLGRVAGASAVEVETFMEVENYSHVMHIVSSVKAVPRAGAKALDALFACFPAGTLSGAPKIRAMEIIDALEPEARGPYGGAAGYLSYGGDLDTCITIRTLVVQPERTTVTAGAGIVADSDPEREEEETRNKAAALLQAVELARRLQQAEEANR
jgi:anthranilate synthase component 1